MDIESLADRTIKNLAIAPGQVIWIWASTHSLVLVEALAFRIRARGVFWSIRLIMGPLFKRFEMNDCFGGRNHSNLHLGPIMLNPSIWMDGKRYLIEP